MQTYTQFNLRKRIINLFYVLTLIFSSTLVYGLGPLNSNNYNSSIFYSFEEVDLECIEEVVVYGPLTAEESGYIFPENSYSVLDISLPSGSIIIDMGVVPQTFENGIKPYGLVYSLIDEDNVPVVWAIDQTKAKDGVDFSVDGRSFRAGSFIISADDLTPSILTKISDWESLGVETYEAQTTFTVPLYKLLDAAPKWTINDVNENIIINYLEEAEIPEFDSNGNANYTVKLASQLDACDDLFVMPHDDSQNWVDEGSPMFDWNRSYGNGGSGLWIWAGCKAVSQIEALVDPSDQRKEQIF